MTAADKAFAEAERLIAEAKAAGADRLSLNIHATHALTRLPDSIAGLTNLSSLDLMNTQVSDLTPLAGMAGMTRLSLINTPVSDLTPLAGMAGMTGLSLSNTPVSDLTPLAGMAGMTGLSLSNTQVGDLAPLARMVGMTGLALSGTQVGDLKPLEGMVGIEVLDLENTKISDLTPLAGMARMRYLRLNITRVNDLTPLAGMARMTRLCLGITLVSDLRVVLGMPKLASAPDFQGLTFRNTPFTRADVRAAEIAGIGTAKERAAALFAYLKDWVPPGEVALSGSATGTVSDPPKPFEEPFVFLSCANQDLLRVGDLHKLLQGASIPLWWYPNIPPGASGRADIAERLKLAKAVVTFWTKDSTVSKAVIEEAATAQRQGKLIHVRLDDAPLPYGFAETQYLDLRNWDGTANHPEMRKLIQVLRDRIAPPTVQAMTSRIAAASPIAMVVQDGRLSPRDTPPNERPEITNAPDLSARLGGLRTSLVSLQAFADDRDHYQFPQDLRHVLTGAHNALHAEPLTWYALHDARDSLVDCMDQHDAARSWNTVMFNDLTRFVARINEVRPLLQPRQVPPDQPGAKPPEPDPIIRADEIPEVTTLILEIGREMASPEAEQVFDGQAQQLVATEIATVNDGARAVGPARFAPLRRGVRGLTYLVGATLAAVSTGVMVNLLTTPEAALTLAARLKPLLEALLRYFR